MTMVRILMSGFLSLALGFSIASAQNLGERRVWPVAAGASDFVNIPAEHRVFPAGNAVDNDKNSMWSCAGQSGNCYIVFEFYGDYMSAVELLFHSGDKRQFTFDVFTSNGGQGDTEFTIWEAALIGATSEMKSGYQRFNFAEPHYGIYVKIIGYGNNSKTISAQQYTSIKDVRFIATPSNNFPINEP